MSRDVVIAMRFCIVTKDEFYMKEALKQARKAYLKKETPIGAVLVYQDTIIARAYNQRQTKQNVLAHAEISVLNKACKKLGAWRLEECCLYVTLEPCVMCTGATIQSRLKRVVYGAKNHRFGCHQSAIRLFDVPFNHQVSVTSGILEVECSRILTDFFQELREKKPLGKNG